MKEQSLILASSSKYRRELLERLGIPFQSISPNIDESARVGETPTDLVERLSLEKALHIAQQYPQAWVIGSDQVADFHGAAMGKPGAYDRAFAQLKLMQGQKVVFRTGMCLMQHHSATRFYCCVNTEVTFRTLDDKSLENYLHIEQPFDCAGSAKAEGLGISLVSAIQSSDPTALIGLPLIALTGFLMQAGFSLFTQPCPK